jgi:uncharacterized membrane protein
MSSLESSKNLAGIGAILLFLSFIPFVGIIGLILMFIGVKGLSEYYKEPGIYQDALKGLIFGIVGLVVTAVGIIFAIGIGILTFGIGTLLIIFVLLVVDFVFYLLMAMNFKRAFSLLAQRTGEHSFDTAGTLLWWGAILTIIGVGLILIFIAWIFATIGFFGINAPEQQSTYMPPPSPVSSGPSLQSTQTTHFCPNCGVPVDLNATFCPNCGKPLN